MRVILFVFSLIFCSFASFAQNENKKNNIYQVPIDKIECCFHEEFVKNEQDYFLKREDLFHKFRIDLQQLSINKAQFRNLESLRAIDDLLKKADKNGQNFPINDLTNINLQIKAVDFQQKLLKLEVEKLVIEIKLSQKSVKDVQSVELKYYVVMDLFDRFELAKLKKYFFEKEDEAKIKLSEIRDYQKKLSKIKSEILLSEKERLSRTNKETDKEIANVIKEMEKEKEVEIEIRNKGNKKGKEVIAKMTLAEKSVLARKLKEELLPKKIEEDQMIFAELMLTEIKLSNNIKKWTITLPNNLKIQMVTCPSGSFVMGSPISEIGRFPDETERRVTISKTFFISKSEITQEQYEAVVGNNPSSTEDKQLPVDQVSWKDAMEFCRLLNELEEKELPNGYRYSLPTEAQWEYACRANTKKALNNNREIESVKNECTNLDKIAWYNMNSDHEIHNVCSKEPNNWGIYDMHGNLWEWCLDSYGPYLGYMDPIGVNGDNKVIRGGGWDVNAANCRSANRGNINQNTNGETIGFRIVLAKINQEIQKNEEE